ncbi:MAG: hypothetical protein ACI9ON_001691 [Limisphaerales bacterium]|jgi:hypothetical protein
MSGLHIEDFYKDAGRSLVILFQVFPRPVPIYVEDICGPDKPDEYGVHSRRHQACFATLLWLAEEGFIRCDDTIRQEAIDQAVLTGRCFTNLLKASPKDPDPDLPPSVQTERRTYAYQLSEAVQKKSTQDIEDVMIQLLSAMTT